MFFPSQRSEFAEPRAGPGHPPPSVKPSRKEPPPQKSPLKVTPSKSNLYLKRPSSSASHAGSRPTSVASSIGMGRMSTVPDNRPPPPSSEELVTRLFKGLGVPLYEPRIPATYQQEIVSSALKNYRWGAFDLSIYHDTMLTIAKPPPTPPVPVVEPPPAPPVEDTIESPLLLMNAPEPQPEPDVVAPKPQAIEPVTVNVQPSAKVRLTSQKMQPSSKATNFSTKMGLKVNSGDSGDFKEARSVKRTAQSTKGLSIKVSAPNSPLSSPKLPRSPRSPKSPNSPKAVPEAPVVDTVVLPPPSPVLDPAPEPEPEPMVETTVPEPVEEPAQNLNSEIESEQLIDGLLDLSIAYSTAAAGYATNVSRTPKSIKIPDPSGVSSKSKSVKSPTSFFSGLMSSLSTKVSSVVSEGGKSTKARKNVDFAALGIDDPDSFLEESTAMEAAAEPTNTNDAPADAPVESPKQVEETVETEGQFNFLSEAAQLAAEVAEEESDGEKSTEARQSGSPLTVFPAPIVSFSPEGKQQPHEAKIISPAERSVFKPTFAMPRPVPLQQDPIAALLVSDLQGGKRFALQTQTAEVSPKDGPLSGPKSKRKRNSFGSLEEAGLDAENYPRLPAKAGKYVAEMLESDSENEILTARAQARAQEKQTRKTKKKTKENDRERKDVKDLNFAKNQLGPDGEPVKVKAPKQAKPSPKQQPAAKQWYMAGAYSSHHEAIDAINRMHKLLASQSPHKHGDDADLDETFRLQRDLSRMQWVVECNDLHQKALILSHATRSPVVPEKDKSKYRNITNALKEPAAQGPGAALYHSPTQRSTEKEHREHREHKHGDEMYLRERDAFHEMYLRQVKHNLPDDFKEEGGGGAHSSPPPRQQQHGQGAEGGTRFPPIPQAQQAQAQPKRGKKGK